MATELLDKIKTVAAFLIDCSNVSQPSIIKGLLIRQTKIFTHRLIYFSDHLASVIWCGYRWCSKFEFFRVLLIFIQGFNREEGDGCQNHKLDLNCWPPGQIKVELIPSSLNYYQLIQQLEMSSQLTSGHPISISISPCIGLWLVKCWHTGLWLVQVTYLLHSPSELYALWQCG